MGSDSVFYFLFSKVFVLIDKGVVSVCVVGVYISFILILLVVIFLESFGVLDKFEGFVSGYGRKFYGEFVKEG